MNNRKNTKAKEISMLHSYHVLHMDGRMFIRRSWPGQTQTLKVEWKERFTYENTGVQEVLLLNSEIPAMEDKFARLQHPVLP